MAVGTIPAVFLPYNRETAIDPAQNAEQSVWKQLAERYLDSSLEKSFMGLFGQSSTCVKKYGAHSAYFRSAGYLFKYNVTLLRAACANLSLSRNCSSCFPRRRPALLCMSRQCHRTAGVTFPRYCISYLTRSKPGECSAIAVLIQCQSPPIL
jgi:hypothetical protein